MSSLGYQPAWSHGPAGIGMDISTRPGTHLQGPRGHPVHDGGPLQAALLQLPQVHFVELLQVLGDGQVVVCWGRAGLRRALGPSAGQWGPWVAPRRGAYHR